MRKPELYNRVVGLIVVALIIAPWLLPISASGLSKNRPFSQPSHITPLEYLSVFSDFDGDNEIDQAELTSSGQYKNIQVDLSNSPRKSLSFDTGVLDRGKLLSSDIDNDNDEDLIWVSQSLPNKLVFWLSDGHGNFTISREPPPDPQKITALLSKDSESKLSEGMGAFDLSNALLPSDSTELELPRQFVGIVSLAIPLERSEERSLFAPFLSVLSRRGPPIRLS